MADLPPELINEILVWLPAKSLLRFRCVSKSFCALIGSQLFINSHFQRCSANNIYRKLINLVVRRTNDKLWKIHALEFNEDFEQEVVLDKVFPSELDIPSFSYCNGLVLLFLLPCELSVWNPSTRKYRILPALPVKYTQKRSFGLGYDSTANDYKVVVIISMEGCETSQVWIFELRSSCWRRIQDFPYIDYDSFKYDGNGDCFVDGALHFRCRDGNVFNPSDIFDGTYTHPSDKIVAFDVVKETFSILHDPIFQPRVIAIRLHVYVGCLSVILYNCAMRDRVDIYVRKKDGVAFTWTRLYSIERQQFAFRHFLHGEVAYSKEGNKVLFPSWRMLYSYDFKEKSLQELVTMNFHSTSIFSYTESLMSVA